MATDQTVLNMMGKAMWDPAPTETDLRSRQLAAALGYPLGWRVVRTIEQYAVPVARPAAIEAKPKEVRANDTGAGTVKEGFNEGAKAEGAAAIDEETKKLANGNANEKPVDKIPKVDTNECKQDHKVDPANSVETKTVDAIVDRIYAGKPASGCDMWVNHEAAMLAAQRWMEKEEEHENPPEEGKKYAAPTPFDNKGGHLLPRQAKFTVGDKVSVSYEGEWWDAKILRCKEHTVDGFRYQVYYAADGSKQSGIAEELIQQREDEDPSQTAVDLGLGEDWKAFSLSKNKWKIVSPDGTIYKSKKAALQACKDLQNEKSDEGDPPWRKTGNDYLGRQVRWTFDYKKSARRSITIEQIGIVEGWISETDVDQQGEPGFVSERTGKPAALFHVAFDDDPKTHPYGNALVDFVDLEEFELKEHLIPPEDEVRSAKKARTV